ncbi:hypothetical protein BH10PAT1_BH10PAT1_3450 [soil metagenome]
MSIPGEGIKMPKGIPRDQTVNREILHRLKIARGHMDKVIKMVEEKEYCIDIVHQSMAVQSALKKADNIIMRNHLETCAMDSIKKGNAEEAIEEVVKILEKK